MPPPRRAGGGGGGPRKERREGGGGGGGAGAAARDEPAQGLLHDPATFIAGAAVAAACAAVVSACGRHVGGTGNTVPVLLVIMAFAAVYIRMTAQAEKLAKQPPPKPVQVAVPRPDQVFEGSVKRFSAKNGWGLITSVEAAPDSGGGGAAATPKLERDVRFYAEDQQALNLAVGDVVAFHVKLDPDAHGGWLRAFGLRRTTGGRTPKGDPEASSPAGEAVAAAASSPPVRTPPSSDEEEEGEEAPEEEEALLEAPEEPPKRPVAEVEEGAKQQPAEEEGEEPASAGEGNAGVAAPAAAEEQVEEEQAAQGDSGRAGSRLFSTALQGAIGREGGYADSGLQKAPPSERPVAVG